MRSSSASDLFAHCNHTEVYQICRRLGLAVDPAMPRDQMISFLTGDAEPPVEERNTVDSWRHGIMGFLLDNWEVVRAQLDCPAKSGDPRACFSCVDARVISCVATNPENEHLIQIKRKYQ